MKINVNTGKRTLKMRILSAFMAFLIFTMTCPELFEGWGIGLIVHAEEPSGNIHYTNTDNTSLYKDAMNTNRTGNTSAPNTMLAQGSGQPHTGNTFTYTGKYNNNNKTTVFDYVSDYELAANGGTYNTCHQTEAGYTDVYTTLNDAISEDYVSDAAVSDKFRIIFKPADSYKGENVTIYFYTGSNYTNGAWPGNAKMSYDKSHGVYYFISTPVAVGNPTKFIINDGNASSTKWETDVSFDCPAAGKSLTVTQTDADKILIRFQSQDTSPSSLNIRFTGNNGGNNDQDWTTDQTMTKYGSLSPVEYRYELTNWENKPYRINQIWKNSYDGDWHTESYELEDMRAGMSYLFKFREWGDQVQKMDLKKVITASAGTPTNYYDDVKYSAPLYFGDFWQNNSANGYDTYNKPYYNNFYWQASIGMKSLNNVDDDDTTNSNHFNQRGHAAVQDLVYDKLSGSTLNAANAAGDILDKNGAALASNTVSGNALPMFSKSWINANDDRKKLIKYYDTDTDTVSGEDYAITFPFYETYSAFNNSGGSNTINSDTVKLQTYDTNWNNASHNEVARFYQFDSKEANLRFNITDSTNHKGYFSESTGITGSDIYRGWWDNGTYHSEVARDRSNVGFFPFNTTNSENTNTNNHNLGFGTKMSMDFQLESDGCVSAVKLNGSGQLEQLDTATRIHTIFEFTGDDDLWVFIDGNLVLDMGGPHFIAHGMIDFADISATVDQALKFGTNSSGTETTAYDALDAAITTKTLSGSDFIAKLAGNNTTDGSGNPTYDTSVTHTMTIFYMERGMLDSNLLIRYNYSPISNTSRMKIAEVTKFTGINPGLLPLTKKVAEDDVFKYTVTNTIPSGVTKETPLNSGAVYPVTASYKRTAEDGTTETILTPNGDVTPDEFKFSSGGANAETYVKNTSYWWVDEFSDTDYLVGKTTNSSGTAGQPGYKPGGDLWLMYGTNDSVYDSTNTGKESSAEFEKQFTKNSNMKIVQGANIYRLNRSTAARLFNSDGTLNATETSTRAVADYYSTNYRLVDRAFNQIFSEPSATYLATTGQNARNATFEFKNDDSVSEHLAVMLTEYVENTVKTRDLSVTKKITGLTTNPKDTEYQFRLTLTNVFDDSTVSVSDYSGIVVSKSGEIGTSTLNAGGTFTLKKGQTLTIKGIPYGTKYTVQEINTNQLHQQPNADTDQITGQVTDPTKIENTNVAVEVSNNYKEYVEVTAEKKTADSGDASDAELELWYKESTPPQTYTNNDPQIVPNKVNGMTVSKSPSDIGIPGPQESSSSYTYYTNTPSYSNHAVPSSEDTDWILPRSDSDYIYFRDYNVGQYAADNDKQSFTNTGKRSWRYTKFADKEAATSSDPKTHNQDQELGFTDNYWFAAEFYGNGKKTVKYAMWERFVDDFTYTPYDGSSATTVKTVVWKIQPPDGYDQVRFILLDGDNWIRSTEKIDFHLGEIYHKTNWGGNYSNGNYYDVPVNKETTNENINYNRQLWAPAVQSATGSVNDKRNTAIDQPRKYEPTNRKIIFCCNSEQVWHNIHIEFFTQDDTSTAANAISVGGNKYVPVNNQAFPGYMMEPYAYAESNYRLRSDGVEQYLTYELTIPEGATHFRINNGVDNSTQKGTFTATTTQSPYAYRTNIQAIQNDAVKNGGNYFLLNESATSTQTCLSGGNPTAVTLVKDTDGAITNLSKEDKTKTYTDSDVTSDCDYIYFMKETSDTSWGNKVYAYFYGGGNLRDDNWQRACYSAWPGVAPAGTDYQWPTGTDYAHSNTYSISTAGNTYNGNVTDNSKLSPDATFSYTKDGKNYTVYKFRIPMGDRKNYSKVIFNNGLGGGQETGVIDYHSGYMYTKNGTSTQRYENKPTVTYTGRSVTINEGEQNEETWTEYVYIRNRQNLDDPHITFYDGDGNQILQKGCGYVMDYAGKRTDDDPSGTYEYYRMPIPAKAASFSVNNGKGTTATAKAEIIRYGTDGKVKSDANASSSDRFVYDLYSNALTRLTYSAGTPQAHTVTTTEGQTESTHNYTVRQTTTGVDDTLNIRDDAPWDVAIGGARVTFYDEHGAPIGDGAYTMIKTNADSDDKVWYTKKIPEGAVSFSVSYTKGSTPTTTTTPKYPIYPGTTAGADGNVTTSGNMYYKTESGGKLSLIYTESTYSEVNDETYAKRGDDLYLKCLKSEKTTNWKDMTVTFYTGSGTVIRSGVTAKFVNDDGNNSWYKVSIPEGAEKFTVTGGVTPHTTDKESIYELRSKYSRYRKDYTLGDMQYELPSSSSETPNKATLLYPIFTPDDEYTLELGNGQTISSIGSLIPVDETQVSTYAGAAGETRPTTTAENVSPVLYNTSSTNITYSWEDGAGGADYAFVRFEKPATWSGVQACYYNPSNSVVTVNADSYSGSTYKFKNDNNYTKVYFRDTADNTKRTIDIDLIGDATHTYGYGYLYETATLSDNGTDFTTYNNNLLVQVVEPGNASVSLTTDTREVYSGTRTTIWVEGTTDCQDKYRVWFYRYGNDNDGSYISGINPISSSTNTGGGPNNVNSRPATLPSNADLAYMKFRAENSDGTKYVETGYIKIADIPLGYGIAYSGSGTKNYKTFKLSSYGGNMSDGTSTTTERYITEITFSGEPIGASTVTYTYQPEDRYGMLSEQNTNNDSTLGFNDVNDFIYVTVPDSITKPYIKFFDASSNLINAAVSNGSSNGLLLNATGLTLNGEEYSMLASEDAVAGTKTYRVRLPKNARSFAICDGTATGTAYSLYSTAAAPLTVRADNGQIPAGNYEGNTVELKNFHHAGSSFSVNGSTLEITLTDVRDSYTTVKSEMEDPITPKTDADYVFLTLPSGLSGWSTPYAYFYGAQDGEYSFTQSSSTITWPGIRASSSYTDKNNRTVYRFQIPKTTDGKYGYVMFNSGTYTTDNITEGKALIGGKNYILDSTAAKKDYGASVKAYALTPTAKAPNTTTKDYSLGSYIYIVNNGTQDLTNTTVESSRTTLDEMHVVFFADADGLQVVGSGSLNAYQDAGYIPDKVGTYDSTYDVYRMEVPSGAKYFQINNGYGKGTKGTNYSLRVSEIKALTPNGLYQFVQGETAASKYIEGTTYPTNAETRQNPRYLLTLVNAIPESDEEQPVTGTIDIHLATIVTDTGGTQKYIKWLKMNEAGTQVDTNYLAHTTSDIYPSATLTTVKVKKDGEYYWKEVVAPSGYKVNPNVTNFTISEYDHTNTTAVPTIVDEANPTGSLTLNKKLSSKKPNSGTNDGEGVSFTFTVTLTAPVGTKWTNYTQSLDNLPTGASLNVVSTEGLTRVLSVVVPATATDVKIMNIPSGTSYYVTETAPDTNYNSTPVSISETMYKTVNSTPTSVTGTVEDIDGTIPSYTDDQSTKKNNVKYVVTNKREVGSLTLAKTVTGDYATASITKGTTEFTYTVTLTHPDNVDLRDYLAWSAFSSIGATVTKINGSDVTSYTESYYNAISSTLESVEFTVSVKCDNGSKTIGNLPMGTKYTVTENGANGTGTGWSCSTTGQVSSETTLSISVPNPAVTITNNYTDTSNPPTPSSSKVILTKTAKEQVGNTKIGDKLGNAKFLLYVNDGDNNDNNDSLADSFTLSSGEYNYGSGTFNTGTNYLVTGNDNSSDPTHYGKLVLNGLPKGDYYLQEEVAPAGFSNMDSNTRKKKRVYFSVGDNTVTKNIICSDEMDAAYIRLFEHINEKKEAWGDPTFIFKIRDTVSNKTSIVALTVDDNDMLNDKVLSGSVTGKTFTDWKVEATDELENGVLKYQGEYHIDSQGRIKVAPGSYEITRIPVSRYKFVTSATTDQYVTEPSPYTQIENKDGSDNPLETVTITNLQSGKTIDVHYYDEVGYYDKFSHVDTKVNKFYKLDNSKKNTTVKGISISNIPSTLGNTTDTTRTVNVNAYKVFVDGTVDTTAISGSDLTIDFGSLSGLSYNNGTITITDATTTHAHKVYTLTAKYDNNRFTTTFDIAIP